MKFSTAILLPLLLAACATKPTKVLEPVVQPINEKSLEENAALHNHDVLNCYMKRLKTKPGLVGELQLEFNVSPEGEMKDAKVTNSVDAEFDRCVLDVARSWKFPWNVRNGSTDTAMYDIFNVHIENGQPRSAFEEKQMGMDREAIRTVVRDHLKDVNSCYQSRLMKRPGLVGKAVLDWEIWANGFAHDVKVKKSLDPVVDQCLIDKLKTWQFPLPPKGLTGRVDFPFVFATE